MKTVPLKDIRFGHDAEAPAGVVNVRAVGRDAGLPELAASIGSLGLLQPLIVVPGLGDIFYVADGNRRLSALNLLVSQGLATAEHAVPVIEQEAGAAREVGLAANVYQAPMHDADRHAAFSALRNSGLDATAIAARFGLDRKVVFKSLALGGLAPEVMDAWRGGEFGRDPIETVRFFTLAPVEEQARVLNKLRGDGSLSAWMVKREFGMDGSDISRRMKFVGRDAYVAAGGAIGEDLFGEDHRVCDPTLLKGLADEKIIAVCEDLRSEGWSWAVPCDALPDGSRWSWGRVPSSPRPATPEEVARFAELQAVVQAYEDDSTTEDDGSVAAAEDEIERIEIALSGCTAADMARSGCVVTLQHNGSLDIQRGVIRPATTEAAKAFAAIKGTDEALAVKAAKAEPATVSAALALRLSQQQTVAVREAIQATPQVALAVLLAGALSANAAYGPVCVRIEGYAPEQARPKEEAFADVLTRLVGMPINDLLVVASGVAGRALDLQVNNVSKTKGVAAIFAAVDQDRLGETLADKFDAADYFKSAPKAVVLKAIEEVLGAAEAKRVGSFTKAELVATAMARVVGTGWLPPEIRHPGYGRQRPKTAAPVLAAAPSKAPTLAAMALASGALSMRPATAPDRAEVHTAIAEVLPPGVPTYAKEIVAVHRTRGSSQIVADVRLFDDAVGRIEISGEKGGRGYQWHHSGVPGTAFHWDKAAGEWQRIPDIAA